MHSPEVNSTQGTNHLANETSPYLLQHAHNPVEWYPWGEEALQRALEEDKPILLSIGYSACHWCHVMAHESFENEETAALMNRYFINIKVDREERPDLDRIYQTAHQLLTRRPGGWPLTMVLTPDQTPFVGGTYFPPEPRYGLPGFRDILRRIHDFYRNNREEIDAQNTSICSALQQPFEHSNARLDDAPLQRALQELSGSFDKSHGGFGGAPKFPHVANLQLLLRMDNDEAREMALFSLRKMAEGGLLDQLGGGFYRYAVDERWEIPHFEKMLYDNGPLLQCYVEAWQLQSDDLFRQVIEHTAGWVMREMQLTGGGYAASQDADSNGEEGGFYVWTAKEIQTLLTDREYAVVSRHFGLDQRPNFEGRWHLKISEPLGRTSIALGQDPDQTCALRDSAVRKLLTGRSNRVIPGRDEKVLVSWNALMIQGMAYAGMHLKRLEWLESATCAVDLIHNKMFREGRLQASYKDGQVKYRGYLDDYAFLISALLTLLEARWRDSDLHFACELAEALLEHFEDENHGGFYFTADDHEALIQRPKPFMDESMPGGNGIAATALLRLGHLTGDLHYIDAAEKGLRAGWQLMKRYPSAHGAMLCALQQHLYGGELFVLRGKEDVLESWRSRLHFGYHPHRQVFAIPESVTELPKSLAQKSPAGEAVAYHCQGLQCLPPLTDINLLPE